MAATCSEFNSVDHHHDAFLEEFIADFFALFFQRKQSFAAGFIGQFG